MTGKIINATVQPFGDGQYNIEFQTADGESCIGYAGTLEQALAHGIQMADGAERIAVVGHEVINGKPYVKVGAVAR